MAQKIDMEDKDSINWKESIVKWIVVIIVCTIGIVFSGCSNKTHVITEWDGDREIRWYTTDETKIKNNE